MQWSPPPGEYPRFSKSTLTRLFEEGRIYFGSDGKNVPRKKNYLSEISKRMPPVTVWPVTLWVENSFGKTTQANSEATDILGEGVFENPKPIKLIKKIIDLATGDDDIVIDFFAGSCTTAHAVMQLNAEDGGQRSFIMVQINEETSTNSEAYKAGYKKISEIGRERIRRAPLRIKKDLKKQKLKMPFNLDLGFKSFVLDSSNFKTWDTDPAEKIKELQQRLEEHIDKRVKGRKEGDFLYEILLMHGYFLTEKIQEKTLAGHKCYVVGESLFCFENKIKDSFLSFLEETDNPPFYIFIFDHALESSLRISLYHCMKNKESELSGEMSGKTIKIVTL